MLTAHYRLSGTGTDSEHETKGLVKGFCEALIFGRILKPDLNPSITDPTPGAPPPCKLRARGICMYYQRIKSFALTQGLIPYS